MKNYLIGSAISIICLILLLVLNSQIYSNVMSIEVLIFFLVFQVVMFKYLIQAKKYVSYIIFTIFFIALTIITLPELTTFQAKQKASSHFDVIIEESSTIPIEQNSRNPLLSDRAYIFKGTKQNGQPTTIMINPNTGKAQIINP